MGDKKQKKVPERAWRVVYGETIPAWEKIFWSEREAHAFARKHRRLGDIVFGVARVVPGEPPRSLMKALGV